MIEIKHQKTKYPHGHAVLSASCEQTAPSKSQNNLCELSNIFKITYIKFRLAYPASNIGKLQLTEECHVQNFQSHVKS